MLIDLRYLVKKYNVNITGIIHVGAHECEEMDIYNKCGVKDDSIIWIEADSDTYTRMNGKIKNLYNVVISDKDNEVREFNVTNNNQSSSLLNLKTHLIAHPTIHVINKKFVTTKTLDTFFSDENIDITKYNFLNIDIQGAELLALKGMSKSLHNMDYLYLEVNTEELYENCAMVNEIDQFVSVYGFKRIETKMTGVGWGDAFYIK
uniref:Methyltransferase FkbM domain-containing protein n=1 Tax=viral metagenome TaxID=1070528 RepID=A0A6C0J7X9_9ZZZZ